MTKNTTQLHILRKDTTDNEWSYIGLEENAGTSSSLCLKYMDEETEAGRYAYAVVDEVGLAAYKSRSLI